MASESPVCCTIVRFSFFLYLFFFCACYQMKDPGEVMAIVLIHVGPSCFVAVCRVRLLFDGALMFRRCCCCVATDVGGDAGCS